MVVVVDEVVVRVVVLLPPQSVLPSKHSLEERSKSLRAFIVPSPQPRSIKGIAKRIGMRRLTTMVSFRDESLKT